MSFFIEKEVECNFNFDYEKVAETVVSALMPSSGIEPETRGFSVLCSTN